MQPGDLTIIFPELVLAIYSLIALLVGAYFGKDKLASMMLWVTSGLLLVVAIWIGLQGGGRGVAFGGMFVDDNFARFAKIQAVTVPP